MEESREILREYLLKNRNKVVRDLDNMRKDSTGDDIFDYIIKLQGEKKSRKISPVSSLVDSNYFAGMACFVCEKCEKFIAGDDFSVPEFVCTNEVAHRTSGICAGGFRIATEEEIIAANILRRKKDVILALDKMCYTEYVGYLYKEKVFYSEQTGIVDIDHWMCVYTMVGAEGFPARCFSEDGGHQLHD